MEQANGRQRSTEQDQETRRRILKAAERLFLARGFKGVSMKDIAEEVHVTSAALYYHFPEGKQELFLNMVNMLFEEWYANVKRLIAQASSLKERLLLLARYQMTEMTKYQSTFTELRRDIEQYSKEDRQRLFLGFQQRSDQLVTDIFQQGIDEGEIAGDVPAHVLTWIFMGAFMGGFMGRHFSRKYLSTEQDNLDPEAYVSMLVKTLLDGMRHPKTT